MNTLIKNLFVKFFRAFRKSGVGRFYGINILVKLLIPLIKSNIADVDGHKIFLDRKDSLRLSICGNYEPFETAIVKSLLKRGDVILDIGANIGYYTLIMARAVGETGKVYAFEPDPSNFALLKRNVEINGYNNVVILNKAVSNVSGETRLFLSENNMGDHRIWDAGDGRKSVTVGVIALDDYFDYKSTKVDFIKMDIQGAEPSAIKGMIQLLKNNKKIKLITEISQWRLKVVGSCLEEYLGLLEKLDFEIYGIDEKTETIEPVTRESLLRTLTRKKSGLSLSVLGNLAYENLLCVKGCNDSLLSQFERK